MQIEKPKYRSPFRKYVGKKYFCAKRSWHWLINFKSFARKKTTALSYSIFEHRSLILRPLKDVDMYLQVNKRTNLEIAVRKIDSIIIEPNQTFSLWKLVGKPTKRKGYLEGLVLDGGKITTGIGGGLCQLGNLLYWTTLHSPLTITERYRHSYDVFPDVNRTIPFACGATLSYNYIDLQIKNNTPHSYQFNIWLDETHLNCRLLSSVEKEFEIEVFETDHQFRHQPWGGYTRHNKIWRKMSTIKTNEKTEELIAENNAIMMYAPFLKNTSEQNSTN